MANTADIIVNLISKTARFEAGVRRANKSLTVMEKTAKASRFAMRALGAAIAGLSVGRAAASIRQQLNFAANLQRVAETVSFTTSQVQELRFASEQLNLTQRTIDLGLQRFSRRVAEAAQGQGELLKVAEQYNLVLKDGDGNLRSNIDLLQDLAGVVANAGDEQEQLRIAFKAFDTEGASLVRLLRQGSDGIQQFRDEAQRLGLVVSDAMVNQAAEADRQLNQLSQVLRTRLLIAVAENIEPIQDLAEGLNTLSVGAVELGSSIVRAVKQVGTGLGERIAELTVGSDDVVEFIGKQRERLRDLERLRDAAESGGGLIQLRPEDRQALEAEIAQLEVIIDQFFDEVEARSRRANQIAAEVLANMAEAAVPQATALGAVEEVDISEAVLRANVAMARRQRIVQLIQQSRSREARILSDIRFVNEEILKNTENQNALIEVRKKLFDDLQDSIDAQLTGTTALTQFGIQAARNLQDAFSDFFLNIDQGFDGLLQSFTNLLRQMIAELAARQTLLAFFGAFSGGSGPIASFASALVKGIDTRQAGGPLAAGQPALVGERGPELFVPQTAGTVVPSGKFGNINVNNTVNVAAGVDVNTLARTLPPLLEQNRQATIAELTRMRQKGRF